MKLPFSRYRITTKLILMNLLLICIFGATCIGVYYSLVNIQKLVTRVIDDDVNRNLQNAAMLRELSGVFAGASHLAGVFIKKEALVAEQGEYLVRSTRTIAAKSTDSHLKRHLAEYAMRLDSFIDQCARVNVTVRHLDRLGEDLEKKLSALEKTIVDKKVDLILKGYDPTIMEQLAALEASYHDSLQEIKILYARCVIEHADAMKGARQQQILAKLDDLNLRLQTLTASEPGIAAFGPSLTATLLEYRKAILLLFQTLALQQHQLEALESAKGGVIGIMNEIDAGISRSTRQLDGHVQQIMVSSRQVIMSGSIIVVVLSGLLTIVFILSTIRKPMALISQGINRIRAGDLDTVIALHRQDEWCVIEDGLNRMTAELRRSDTELRAKNANLVTTHAKLSANVIELRNQVEARKRAELELERKHGQLEEMVRERTAELEDAQEELVKREKLSVLGQLTATVSHELRNPLGVIRSSAFYLQQKLGTGDEKLAKHLDRIEKHVGVCDSIVGDLLEFTRGRLSEKVRGDMNLWLAEVLAPLSVPAGVALVHEPGPGPAMVWFDREKMRRVVLNLVENALFAVTASMEHPAPTAREYAPRVEVGIALEQDRVRLKVEDNGTGMAEETAAHAFDPLFTTRARGTGLGLAIVRKIVEEHDGTVSLASRPGRGTAVSVLLPLEPQFASRSEQPALSPAQPGPGANS